jgi:6-phosphogluconolactonase
MLHIYSTPDEVSQAMAVFFATTAVNAVKNNGRFTVALTGGSSPKQLYTLLANQPYLEKLPWKDTYFFWGDERCVPFTDSRNNAKMTFDNLLNYVPVPRNQIYPMSGEIAPNESAAQYEQLLHEHFGTQAPEFDLILLGMGNDGHTASLFPHTSVLTEKTRWVKEVYLEDQQMFRVTLTAPLINQAKAIAFLLFGSSKAQILHDVMHGPYQPEHLPTQLIQPTKGEVHWFLDEAAAGNIKK